MTSPHNPRWFLSLIWLLRIVSNDIRRWIYYIYIYFPPPRWIRFRRLPILSLGRVDAIDPLSSSWWLFIIFKFGFSAAAFDARCQSRFNQRGRIDGASPGTINISGLMACNCGRDRRSNRKRAGRWLAAEADLLLGPDKLSPDLISASYIKVTSDSNRPR